jgi:hypothetical protein
LIKQQAIAHGTTDAIIPTGSLSKGLYTVKVIGIKEVSTQKLLVQ